MFLYLETLQNYFMKTIFNVFMRTLNVIVDNKKIIVFYINIDLALNFMLYYSKEVK